VAVTRIGSISLTSSDAERLAAFYQDAFGFRVLGTTHHSGIVFSQSVGIDGAEARSVRLGLGEQTLELWMFAQPGEPYPTHCASDDVRFQHLSIVVSDMEPAYPPLPDP